MGNVFYTGDDFPARPFVVKSSLYETLNRLEELYWGIRKAKKAEIQEAVEWVNDQFEAGSGWAKTKYDKEHTGGYRKKTGEYIYAKNLKLPTREGKVNHAIQIPMLLYLFSSDEEHKKEIADMFLDVYPGPRHGKDTAVSGRFCCESCNIQYQRALRHIAPPLYKKLQPKFIAELKRTLTPTMRWKKYPFYYTVLALHDIGTPEVHDFLHKAAAQFNEKIAEKYSGIDRKSLTRLKSIKVLGEYA